MLIDVRPPQWRLRVGDWRIRFRKHLDEEILEILHVRHRSQAYDR
jgi:mRNA-degrading endonuclease RelE of RelBE toxin-antitoxin system